MMSSGKEVFRHMLNGLSMLRSGSTCPYEVSRVSKIKVTTAEKKHLAPVVSNTYKAIKRLRGLLVRLEKRHDQLLYDRMISTMQTLGREPPSDLEHARRILNEVTRNMYDQLQKNALSKWKDKVRTWHHLSKDLYKYLRNDAPTKCTALVTTQQMLTYHPTTIEQCLELFWGGLETWPTPTSKEAAIEAVEDIYSLFMPSVVFVPTMSVELILRQLRRLKKTASGPDGWTRQELKALPVQAWADLLQIVWWNPLCIGSSTLALFKRVPLRKDQLAPPEPSNFRPIDVFSLLFRILTSCQVSAIRPWLHEVLHKTQYASDKGALEAVGQLNAAAEAVLHGTEEIWAFTADFSKLYNTLSSEVAETVVSVFGLDINSAPWLTTPLRIAKGCWRMPSDSVVPFRRHERGLPQGVATSVALSELFVAMYLWRLTSIVRVKTICYVDDLSVIASSRRDIALAFDLLKEFTKHFNLSLAATKTKFWGTYPTQVRELALSKGAQQTDILDALGLQWPLHAGVKAPFPKEILRLAKCRERLKRLAHLPASLATKVQAIVTGCLSLVAYSVLPEPKHSSGLRISVRHALNQPYGAPEVLFHAFTRTSCDPVYTWVVACTRLLSVWLRTNNMPTLATLRSKKALLGRITSFLRWAKRAGWVQMNKAIEVPQCGTIRLDRTWGDIKEEVRVAFRKHAAKELVKRRPGLYEGLVD